MITIPSPAFGLSLIASSSEMVEKNQSIIAWGPMDIFAGRPFEGSVADLSAKWIFFTNNMVLVYACKAPDYIA